MSKKSAALHGGGVVDDMERWVRTGRLIYVKA